MIAGSAFRRNADEHEEHEGTPNMARLGLERNVVDTQVLDRTIARLGQEGVLLPTLGQLANPTTIPDGVRKRGALIIGGAFFREIVREDLDLPGVLGRVAVSVPHAADQGRVAGQDERQLLVRGLGELKEKSQFVGKQHIITPVYPVSLSTKREPVKRMSHKMTEYVIASLA